MSLVQKNEDIALSTLNWQPSASLETLQLRARLLKKIRDFFEARDVLEVETPLLCYTSVPDPFIESIPAYFQKNPQTKAETYYLQTSPEYAMKRLIAAHGRSIYQLTKAFRQGEIGRFHNPEFTILEWYRMQFDHHDLMNDMDEFLQHVLNTAPADRITYAELFQKFLNINPHESTPDQLAAIAKAHQLNIESIITDRDTWLNLLMSHCIEPHLGKETPIFIYDFPASFASLARINPENPEVASRFEVYWHGIELANGFHELQDAKEQRQRFLQQLHERKQLNLNQLPIDEKLLSALAHGLPDCAGVALGIDRLILLATKHQHIKAVLSFDFECA